MMVSRHRSGMSAGLLCWLLFTLCFQLGISTTTSSTSWPLLDNGLEKTIQWDHYSLVINGERVLLFGGEMHPFRLPVPELWEDLLQKIKAMGMRMVSIYVHWGYHAPTPDKVDFSTGGHNLTRFFEMAKDVGLYVMLRPGPYINAELSAGGMALWTTTGAHGTLRLNDTAFTDAWTPYQDGVSQLARPFQLTEDGTILLYQIENEYPDQWKNVAAKVPDPQPINYMGKLEANARKNGIVIPLTHNAPNENGKSWSKDYDTVGAGGDVDIYGLDSYPQCWSCVTAECGSVTPWAVSDYYDHFEQVSPSQPPFMPEFQGGAMNPWAGPAGGCVDRTGVDFVNFYYRDNFAQRVTMLSLYMIYGGTNWGWLAAPFVGSSYDYSAAISEDRSISDKFYELKNLGLFTRVAEELAYTERIGTGAGYSTNNTNVYTTELRDPETGAAFYFIRHTQTASTSAEWFALNVNTSIGQFYVPKISSAIVTSGNEGKVLPTDFHFGNHTLYYATAEVLTYTIIDGKATLVLWTPTGRSGEFYLAGAKKGSLATGQAVTFVPSDHGVIVGYTQQDDLTVLEFDNNVRIILADRKTAWKTFVPSLTNDPKVPVDQTALIVGPYLVRSATVTGNTISVQGDANTTTVLEIFTSSSVTKIRWNGADLRASRTNHSSIVATIPGPHAFAAPKITKWKSRDSLPERDPSYSDSGPAWVVANDTTTQNPAVTAGSTTLPYLLADQYGFHTGIRLWRGRFPSGTRPPTGVYLNVQGGTAFGWSAYLNGQHLGSWLGDANDAAGNLTLSFANATLNRKGGDDNVLLVLHDDSGHDEGSGAINPRGILNATLLGGDGASAKFTSWKVAGTAGGSDPSRGTLDPLRTLYNEGGLAAERLGWHLPGFDDNDDDEPGWEVGSKASPAAGFTGAGVRFYRGTLPLDVPEGLDVSLAFKFAPQDKSALGYRVLLYVNGWQYGRYYPSIAAEDTFPVPAGVLDYGGDNTIGLAVWALQEEGARVDVEVEVRYAVASSFSARFDSSYLRPGWEPERKAYV